MISLKKRTILGFVFLALIVTGCGAKTTATNSDAMSSKSNAVMVPKGESSAAPMGGTYFTISLTSAVSSIKLTDQFGKKFSLQELAGKYLVFANFLTSCQEICPMTSANMREISQEISKAGLSDQVKVVEISVDGVRDTPSRMLAYQKIFNDASWILATASQKDLERLWSFFGVSLQINPITAEDQKTMPPDWQTGKPSTYDVSHADMVGIIKPDLSWGWMNIDMPRTSSGALPTEMRKFLTEEGVNNLESPDQFAWSAQTVISALSALMGKKIG